jgi:hypothetical protein
MLQGKGKYQRRYIKYLILPICGIKIVVSRLISPVPTIKTGIGNYNA